MANRRYEDRYRTWDERRDRDYADDRGYMERAGDEVRSWFGDEEAERRRREDEERDRMRERDWRRRHGMEGPRDWSERTRWYGRGEDRDREYQRDREYDRDWLSRDRDWTSRGDRTARDRGYVARGRDWDDWEGARVPSARDRWSVDEGRTEFSGPPQTFGYRYAGQTSTWEQYRGRGPKGYQRSDTRIYEDICDRLSRGDVDAENIEVQVSKGEVTLGGSVRDRWDKRRAEDIAEDIYGVRDVHNHIRVHRERADLGMSETSESDRPGSVLGVEKTTTTGPKR